MEKIVLLYRIVLFIVIVGLLMAIAELLSLVITGSWIVPVLASEVVRGDRRVYAAFFIVILSAAIVGILQKSYLVKE